MEKNMETLEKLREQLEYINDTMNVVNHGIKDLKQNQAVREYINHQIQYEQLAVQKNKLQKNIIDMDQELCNHPIFYYMYSEPLDYGSKNIIYVRCLKCGKKMADHPRVFIDKLISENTLGYDGTKEEYKTIKNTQSSEEEAVLVLKHRYNKK